MPVGTYIGATEVLGPNRARGLIPRNEAICDCNFVLNYYRLSSDHRLLFGGRVSYSTMMPPNLPAAMRRKMLEVFPGLDDVASTSPGAASSPSPSSARRTSGGSDKTSTSPRASPARAWRSPGSPAR